MPCTAMLLKLCFRRDKTDNRAVKKIVPGISRNYYGAVEGI